MLIYICTVTLFGYKFLDHEGRVNVFITHNRPRVNIQLRFCTSVHHPVASTVSIWLWGRIAEMLGELEKGGEMP